MSTEVVDSKQQFPEWINKDLVQKALRSGDGDQTITVVSTEVRTANAVGDGYASDMFRVTAQLEDGTTRSLIFKCHPQGGKREMMVKKVNAFATEQHMMTKILPAMYELLEEAKPGKYPPFAARCLYHGDDPITFLVLEDLKASGFTLAKRQEGVDMAHCSLVMKSLARFHASSIALHVRDPDSLESYTEGIYGEKLREYFGPYIQGSVRSLANEVKTWPDYNEKYADKLYELSHTFFDRIIEVSKHRKDAYNVLVHGDPWCNNMMFKYIDGAVADFRLVDFQTTHYSSPAIDIHYFLTTSINEEVRRNYISQLMQEYLTVLNQTLEELGCFERVLPLADLNKELDERAFYGFYASVGVLPMVLSKPEDGFDVEESLKGDHENLESTKTIFSSKAYETTMKILLPIFETKGLI